jgi:hypothetical protein
MGVLQPAALDGTPETAYFSQTPIRSQLFHREVGDPYESLSQAVGDLIVTAAAEGTDQRMQHFIGCEALLAPNQDMPR